MDIDCANISRAMWIKSVLQFASNHSQNCVFSISSVFCRLIFVIQDRIFNARDGWSSPHINTGFQLGTLR
jgi:hypothetical protein